MDALIPFIPPGAERAAIRKLAHLHNDLIDFAVTGGVVGILSYLVSIFSPVIAAIYSVKNRFHQVKMMGIALLVTSYFVRGLTDLMFGFEANSLYFVLYLAVFLGFFCDHSNPGQSPAKK